MSVFVRAAVAADLQALEDLHAQAQVARAGFRGHERLTDQIREFEWSDAIADVDLNILLAGIDSVPLGYSVTSWHRSKRYSVATIEQIFVGDSQDSKRLGSALIESIIGWARMNGFDGVDGFALPGDRLTKNLFEDSGLVARLITTSKSLN